MPTTINPSGQTITNHNVLLGAASNLITNLAPSATTGSTLLSAGSSADPAFSTTFSVVDSTVTATLTSNYAGVVTLNVQNTSTANSSIVSCVANSPGVGFFSSGVVDDAKFWNFGIVPSNAGSNANGYNISYNAVGQADPSGGTPTLKITTAGNVSIPAGDFDVIRSNSGNGVSSTSSNTSDTAGSNASFTASVGGTSAGDCWNQWSIGSTTSYALGPDNSVAGDPLKLTYAGASSVTPSTGTTIMTATSAGAFDFLASVSIAGGTALTSYLQGTFTPVLTFGGASVGITYSRQNGQYVRIGNMILFTVDIFLTSKGSSTGTASITGMPVAANSNLYAFFATTGGMTSSATYTAFCGVISGSANLDIDQSGSTVGSGVTSSDNTNFSDTARVIITGSYFV